MHDAHGQERVEDTRSSAGLDGTDDDAERSFTWPSLTPAARRQRQIARGRLMFALRCVGDPELNWLNQDPARHLPTFRSP